VLYNLFLTSKGKKQDLTLGLLDASKELSAFP
jgi:hypothetical protein